MLRDRDPFLRRIERDAIAACVIMTVVAAVIWWDRRDIPLGVLAGGLVVAISYTGIKSGIDAVARRAQGRAARWALVKCFTRYAIVAAAAYLVMVRVRLHPAAVVAGASSLVIATAAEALRAARNRTYDNPRRS